MSITQDIKAFGTSTLNKVENLVKKFESIPAEGKRNIILKTIAVAAAAGIISALAVGCAGIAIAAVVGLGALAYFTHDYTLKQGIVDALVGGVKTTGNLVDRAANFVDKNL